MKEIKILKVTEDNCEYDEEIGYYKVISDGLDDIVLVKNYPRKEIQCSESIIQSISTKNYKIVTTENCNTYIVKPLDTLEKISNLYNIDVNELVEKNALKSDKLFIGQVLKV